MKRPEKKIQHGMTLLELSVVLLILIALAGLAVPYVGGTGRTAMCQATDATMQTVKEAIMSGAAGNGYYADLLGQLPRDRFYATGYTLHYLFSRDDGLDNDGDTLLPSSDGINNVDPDDEWRAYNATTGVGWRGPYLMTGGQLDAATAGGLHTSFSNLFDAGTNPAGNVHVDHRITTMTQVFDAWHRPIVLQVPYYDDGSGDSYHPEYARLVSAGPGSGLEPGEANIDTTIQYGDAQDRDDDRVLFLSNPDPFAGGNTPCDQS
jgi:prepilin-type N-terminal cleavage/methylation domain-containing protein